MRRQPIGTPRSGGRSKSCLPFPRHKRGDPKKVLDGLRKELNKAGQIYPEIGEKTWHRVAHLYGVEQPTFAKEAAEPPMQARHA